MQKDSTMSAQVSKKEKVRETIMQPETREIAKSERQRQMEERESNTFFNDPLYCLIKYSQLRRMDKQTEKSMRLKPDLDRLMNNNYNNSKKKQKKKLY